MRTALIAVAIGCGGTPTTPAIDPVAPMAKPAFASYAIMTGELGDAGIISRIPHHARLARLGRMWLALDGQLQRDSAEQLAVSEVLPVIGETRDRVRVVSSDDDANLALWIERADLARVIVRESRFETVERMDPGVGVWLAPGTELETELKQDATNREHVGVTVRDTAIEIAGWTSTKAVGTVWVGDVPKLELDPPLINPGTLAAGARVHSAPSFDATDLALVGKESIQVAILESHKPWHEIEIIRAGARVRGFVRDEELSDFDTPIGHGSGHGHGYGVSDIGRIMIPVNACLYDRVNGEVVGVNTKSRERHGHLPPSTEWARVYADTEYWGVVEVYAHVAMVRGSEIIWETCAASP